MDRGEWWMTPQTVNAVNLPLQNALNFPAAILEAPFFDPNADAAANYGAIGAVIGHEISHSFDNMGAEFDADGTLRNWWTQGRHGPLQEGRPPRWSRSTTRTSRCRACTSTASRCSARTSPTSPA